MKDTFGRRVIRRCISIPLVMLGLSLTVALFPLLFCVALIVDVLRRRDHWPVLRLLFFLLHFLFTENLGLLALGVVWLLTLGRPQRRIEITYTVQNAYTAMQMRGVTRWFSLRFTVETDGLNMRGLVIVFVRHASIIDVLIPGVFLALKHSLKLRYVLKRELLWQPCLDVAGNWLPNHFVDRGGSDSAGEVAAVRALKTGLGADEGVLVYPEGTRFTASKRAALLKKLTGPAADNAAALHHVLPMRHGGPLALLEAAPPADVLFVGHVGLEGFASVGDIAGGALTGTTVTIHMWREPATSIPPSEGERLEWLNRHWQRLDAWVATQQKKAA